MDSTPDNFDIPAEVFDQIAAEEAATRNSSGTSRSEPASGGRGSGQSVRTCPHCTYQNHNGGSDCEVCGLPL